ncbi:lysozyme [Cupriavidus sp. BIC8F]|uniref:lysozyme n=1 Tax=Cupriavidus sp. BIC8F TaxID=3079014 RepID=UPI002916D236|nr:lysozyme [Cupriavidus sp. BIC8F]
MKAALELLVSLIMRFEGCRLKAYRDVRGIWTIGWGETAGVKEGMVWTQAQADAVLRMRVSQFLLGVYKRAPMLWLEPPERAAACGSLAYNIGLGAFNASTVKRKTNSGEWELAANAFLLWNKSGGRVVNGLTLRRRRERGFYLSAGG